MTKSEGHASATEGTSSPTVGDTAAHSGESARAGPSGGSSARGLVPEVVVQNHDSADGPETCAAMSLPISAFGGLKFNRSVPSSTTNGDQPPVPRLPDHSPPVDGRASPESTHLLYAQARMQRHSLPGTTVVQRPVLRRSSTAPEVDDELLAPFRRRSFTKETNIIERVETNTEETVNQYRMLGKIGEGSFGLVCKAQAVNTGEEFAVKILSKSRMTKLARRRLLSKSPRPSPRASPARNGIGPRSGGGAGVAAPDPLAQVKREIAILKNLDHPRVINLIEVMDDPEEDNLFLVFELMQHGSVMEDEMEETFDEATSLSYFIDLVLGVEYLHAQNIAHRDIKPQNLLLDASKEHIKITDFGVSEWFRTDGEDQGHEAAAGSPAFMAPETMQQGPRGVKTEFDAKKADIWAMGVTLYCFLFGQLPFNSANRLELHELIRTASPEFPDSVDVSDDCRAFILCLLEKDASKRISIAGMREHPWISQVQLPSVEENCGTMGEVTEAEVATAFSSMSFSDIESLFMTLAHGTGSQSLESTDGGGDFPSLSLRGEQFLSLQPGSSGGYVDGRRSSQASQTSGNASSGGPSPDVPDLTPEQESILQRLAMARRPSFTEQRWSPAPPSPGRGSSPSGGLAFSSSGRHSATPNISPLSSTSCDTRDLATAAAAVTADPHQSPTTPSQKGEQQEGSRLVGGGLKDADVFAKRQDAQDVPVREAEEVSTPTGGEESSRLPAVRKITGTGDCATVVTSACPAAVAGHEQPVSVSHSQQPPFSPCSSATITKKVFRRLSSQGPTQV